MLGKEGRDGVADLLELLCPAASFPVALEFSSRMGSMAKKQCKVKDCGRGSVAKDMCLKHYKRDRYSPWGLAGRPPKSQCAHCEQTAVARGFCPRHWKQWQLHGDPLHADRRRAEQGSIRVDRDGYLVPRGKANIPLHRIVMDAGPGEVVHHIDGVKGHCSEGNLVLLRSQSEHNRVHNSLEEAAFELVRMGVIVFDRERLEYVIAGHAASPPVTDSGSAIPVAIERM